MNFYDFWKSLSDEEQTDFSNQTDISKNYISTQLIYRYKTPPLKKLAKMADASNGKVSYSDLCNFFAPQQAETT